MYLKVPISLLDVLTLKKNEYPQFACKKCIKLIL